MEETPKTNGTPTPVISDEQDGSFLIIDDSVTAKSIPDTAVQLFEATPDAGNTQETTPVSEVSFFSEPVETSEVVPEKTTEIVTEEIVGFHQKKEASPLKKIDFNAYIAEKNAELEQFITNNIRLAEAKDAEIVSYNTQIAEAKETEKQAIEMAKKIAKQAIDKAKESAKQALDERRNIELENDRIKEIKARLSAQA